MNQPLSPAAAAAWEAFNETAERVGVFEDYGDALAASYRALALHLKRDTLQVLAIAAELESTSPRPA